MPRTESMVGSIEGKATEVRRWRGVEEAPLDIWNSLNSLPRGESAKRDGWYPASAVLKNGTRIDCVAFVEKGSEAQDKFYSQIGFLRRKYEFDSSRMIDVSSVASVSASPYKAPSEIQAKMEKCRTEVCKVTLNDGKEYWLAWRTDEFINVPRGYKARDVVDVTEASEEDRKYFPSSEIHIWGDTSDYLSLGLMHVSLNSQEWNTIGWQDRIMLCFFKRPRSKKGRKGLDPVPKHPNRPHNREILA